MSPLEVSDPTQYITLFSQSVSKSQFAQMKMTFSCFSPDCQKTAQQNKKVTIVSIVSKVANVPKVAKAAKIEN